MVDLSHKAYVAQAVSGQNLEIAVTRETTGQGEVNIGIVEFVINRNLLSLSFRRPPFSIS